MDNKQYKEMQVEPGTYIPDLGLNYPQDDAFARMLTSKVDREIAFDENYPWIDDSFKMRLQQWFGYNFIVRALLYPYLRIVYGLKVKGRHWLKKYKNELKNGGITIANHMFVLDCPCVLCAVRARKDTKIPMYAENFKTKLNWFLVTVGGIPVPESMGALKKFNDAFDEFHRRGSWIHVFPEACRWDFYKPLRPFRKGAFTMAYKYKMPLVPCVITYRERTGWRKLFKKNEPLLTVTIGEPIVPDMTNPRKVEVDRLREVARTQMEKMAGITHNPWPIVPEDE